MKKNSIDVGSDAYAFDDSLRFASLDPNTQLDLLS